MKNTHFGFLATGVLLLALSISVQAGVLLTVDISNPMAVKFTATEATSSTTKSVNLSDGITLLGLFASQYNNGNSIALAEQTLFANGAVNPYATALVVNYQSGGSGAGYDLNLFGSGPSHDFTAGIQAFTGEALLTFHISSPNFANVGTTGDIVLGYSQSGGQGTVIGQFQVIPEPSSLVLLACSPLLLGLARLKVFKRGIFKS